MFPPPSMHPNVTAGKWVSSPSVLRSWSMSEDMQLSSLLPCIVRCGRLPSCSVYRQALALPVSVSAGSCPAPLGRAASRRRASPALPFRRRRLRGQSRRFSRSGLSNGIRDSVGRQIRTGSRGKGAHRPCAPLESSFTPSPHTLQRRRGFQLDSLSITRSSATREPAAAQIYVFLFHCGLRSLRYAHLYSAPAAARLLPSTIPRRDTMQLYRCTARSCWLTTRVDGDGKMLLICE
ncbi:hypothetical protein B0H14DRAFT_361585 [Mycena olivaceomarginata]|nr:hypothetical protein B0H14DRAFT_361585 [Mycena olivaceomarginata]